MKKNSPKQTYRKTRIAIIVISLFLTVIFYFFEKSPLIGLRTVSFFCFILVAIMIDHFFEIGFEIKHYVFLVLIGAAGLLFSPLYYILTSYDKILHLISPILASSIVFFMVSKIKMELKWKLLFTFMTVVAILAIFEIGEFGLDKLFNMKNQGVFLMDKLGQYNMIMSPIDDTMTDISIGTIGSLAYVLGYIFFFKEETKERILK
ncbi:MAG: hypothetical protein PHH00_03990 [Candidatus Nanoarchaeia archaeon]|nr:hypothetical protein [Candidatus Nanoarchaeia archaeon]